MKKLITKIAILAVLIAFNIPLFNLNVFAEDVYYAAKGTATVDAEKDEIYDNSMTILFGKSGMTSVKAWALWDESNIYVFAEVYDKTPVDTPSDIFQPWNSDSIEIFINRDGKLTPGYEDDDFQYRIDINGNMSGMNKRGWGQEIVKDDLAKAKAAAKKTDTGYAIEYQIPLLSAVGQEGSQIGFDIGVNNCDIPNNRASLYAWGGGGNSGPNGWKVLEMMNTVPDEFKNQSSNEIIFKAGQNVAFNRVAYMSATAAWGNYPVNALDGDETTYAQTNQPGNVTFTLDLGYSIVVDKINLLFNDVNYPSEFKLEISSDNYVWNDFKLVQNVVGGEKLTLTFEPTDFRYLRLTPIKTVGDNELFGYALNELEVLSAKDQVIVLEQVADNEDYADLKGMPAEQTLAVGADVNDQSTKVIDWITIFNVVLICMIPVLIIVFVVQVILKKRKFVAKKEGEQDA